MKRRPNCGGEEKSERIDGGPTEVFDALWVCPQSLDDTCTISVCAIWVPARHFTFVLKRAESIIISDLLGPVLVGLNNTSTLGNDAFRYKTGHFPRLLFHTHVLVRLADTGTWLSETPFRLQYFIACLSHSSQSI